jgi:hypothetical protein
VLRASLAVMICLVSFFFMDIMFSTFAFDVTKGFKVREATFTFYFLIELMDYDWSIMCSSIKCFVVVLLFLFLRGVANESVYGVWHHSRATLVPF